MAIKTCITPEENDKLKKAVANGEFSLSKLKKTKTSKERLDLVSKYLDDPETSKKVTREIEKRLGSKKEEIVDDYIKRSFSDVPENIRKGVFNKFKRMSSLLGAKGEKDFMEELVAHKFGAYLTIEEANKLEKITNEAIALNTIIVKNDDLKKVLTLSPEEITKLASSKDFSDYGKKMVELENEKSKILLNKTGFKFSDWDKFKGQSGRELLASRSKYLLTAAGELSGVTRSFKATLDLSASFRQNFKMFAAGIFEGGSNLLTGKGISSVKFNIWKKSFFNSFDAFGTTMKYGDHRYYDAVRAEIHAHPYSIAGVYDAAANGYGLRAGVEEQFPSSVPSDIYDKMSGKSTNNLFKASEVAFNAVVLKARFELANNTIDVLKAIDGVNIMDKKYADPAGEFVSAFTGRGGVGGLEKSKDVSNMVNKILFAPRYMASQFSPYFQIVKGMTTGANNPASTLAAEQNIQFIIGTVALTALGEATSAFLEDRKFDLNVLNPISNSFGKMSLAGIGLNRGLDTTGGNASVPKLVGNLVSKPALSLVDALIGTALADKYYDSRLGIWRKKTIFQTADGKPYYDFISGKYAPVPALIKDMLKNQNFTGEKFWTTDGVFDNFAVNIVDSLFMPITAGNAWKEGSQKDDFSTALLVLTAEGFGIGVNDVRFRPRDDEWSALLNTDKKAYWRAVGELWEGVHSQLKEYRTDESFQSLPEKKQREIIENLYKRELKRVLRQDEYWSLLKDELKETKDKRKED
jgi:hypothetical protein